MSKTDTLDNIVIPEKTMKEILRYNFGEEWKKRALRSARANIYIETFLDSNVLSSSGGNCFSTGKIMFSRKDRKPITDEDVTAILSINRGQENHVTHRDEYSVTIHWLCDSSG